MFNWFTDLFSSEESTNSVETFIPQNVVVTEGAGPKVRDYPRKDYSVYWEVFVEESKEHGYKATLRFMNWNGGIANESVFVTRYLADLETQVNHAIVSKMSKFRKD
jgi:hypothetical protein